MAQESNRQNAIRSEFAGKADGTLREERRADRAHQALPHTPPGGEPPETPAPFPSGICVSERKQSVKGSQAAQKRRALDRSLPF